MKKLLFLLFLLLCSTATMLHAGSARVVNVKEFANIRLEPRRGAEVVGQVALDQTVVVLDSISQPWMHVDYQGQTGYINTKYLVEEVAQEPVPVVRRYDRGVKNALGQFISLKYFFIILIILCFVNWSFTLVPEIPYKRRLWVWLLMNGWLLLMFCTHDIQLLVNNHWTGGWLNGYVVAVLNALVFAAIFVLEYNTYASVTHALKDALLDEESAKKFHPLNYLGLIVLTVISIFLAFVVGPWTLLFFFWFLYKTVRMVRLFKPKYLYGLVVVFIAMFTVAACAILFYTFIKMLVIGILAVYAAMAAPKLLAHGVSSAVDNALKPSEPEPVSESEPNTDLTGCPIELDDSDGNRLNARSLNSDASHLKDENGVEWDRKFDGSYRKRYNE